MTHSLTEFFERNTILVYFVYGQVFFVLGLAIALHSHRHSRLELAHSLGWLAAFGFIHGIHEWGHVFIPIQMTYLNAAVIHLLYVVEAILLALSFACLFQFGVELYRERYPKLVAIPLILTVIWGLWFIMPGLALHSDMDTWRIQASIGARYLIGFPGGLLAALGLRYQAEKQIKPLDPKHIYRTLRLAGFALGAYAILGGLIVPMGAFVPANWLNDVNLASWSGIPVPVFRSLTGLLIAVAIIRALEVFDLEVDRRMEHLEIELSLRAERERISRELHDGAIQQVYSAGLILESAQSKLELEHPTRQRLDRAMTVLNGAIASLRAYMSDLQTAPVAISLSEGLRLQTNDPRFTTLIDIALTLDLPETSVFNPVHTYHILAILGEALANAVRHAQAHHVKVKASCQNGLFILMVVDDGQGLNDESRQDGYGLRNMRDRARLLGGGLEIHSAPGRGTQVTLTIPCEGK